MLQRVFGGLELHLATSVEKAMQVFAVDPCKARSFQILLTGHSFPYSKPMHCVYDNQSKLIKSIKSMSYHTIKLL